MPCPYYLKEKKKSLEFKFCLLIIGILFYVIFFLLCYRVDKNEDGRITEEEVKEVV